MDISLTLVLMFMFALPLIFMILGLGFDKAKAVACLVTSAVIWLVFAVTYPVLSGLTYSYLGFVFLVPAVLSFALALPPAVKMWRLSRMEDWEKEDED